MLPCALRVPPGIPDFFTRTRFLEAGPRVLKGRAWSGWAPIERVEVSVDGGATWANANLAEPVSAFAWRGWTFDWAAEPGEHELCCRAIDAAGNAAGQRGLELRRLRQQRPSAARHRLWLIAGPRATACPRRGAFRRGRGTAAQGGQRSRVIVMSGADVL